MRVTNTHEKNTKNAHTDNNNSWITQRVVPCVTAGSKIEVTGYSNSPP